MNAKLNERQIRLLENIRRATDKETPLHRSGDVDGPGLVARGPTVLALERRGLVQFDGFVAEVDGDGFMVTGNDDAPSYVITTAGRAALVVHEGLEDGR